MLGINSILFSLLRISQLLTLPPLLGLSAHLTRNLLNANIIPPTYLLLAFIASVLATVWTLGNLLCWRHTRTSSFFVALVDIGLCAAFIAATSELRTIATADCSNPNTIAEFSAYGDGAGACQILKGCFGLAIVETILSGFSAVLAGLHRTREDVTEPAPRRRQR